MAAERVWRGLVEVRRKRDGFIIMAPSRVVSGLGLGSRFFGWPTVWARGDVLEPSGAVQHAVFAWKFSLVYYTV